MRNSKSCRGLACDSAYVRQRGVSCYARDFNFSLKCGTKRNCRLKESAGTEKNDKNADSGSRDILSDTWIRVLFSFEK